jgi:hypothetical protein
MLQGKRFVLGKAAASFDVTCLTQDLRSNSGALSRTLSISSKHSDTERHVRFAEPAYSFVGMHCIFDNCKASGYILTVTLHISSLLVVKCSIWLIWLAWPLLTDFTLGSYNIEIWACKF